MAFHLIGKLDTRRAIHMSHSLGDKAPIFVLPDQDKKVRNLDDFTQKGNVVLAFFPGAFTSTCTHEMCTLRDSLSRLSSLNSQVVGISVNDPWALKGFADVNHLTFPLLSDFSRSTVKAYGVELPDFGGLRGYTVAQRSIFILDKEGKIRFSWIAPQPSVEPDYGQIEEQLKMIK
jgi:peroxiredoxin